MNTWIQRITFLYSEHLSKCKFWLTISQYIYFTHWYLEKHYTMNQAPPQYDPSLQFWFYFLLLSNKSSSQIVNILQKHCGFLLLNFYLWYSLLCCLFSSQPSAILYFQHSDKKPDNISFSLLPWTPKFTFIFLSPLQ